MTVPFQQLLALHAPRVHRAALGMLGDEQVAMEVAQESLLRAYQARDRYDPERPFYPWLYTIVKNRCRDVRAKQRRRAFTGLEEHRHAHAGPTPLAEATSAQARIRVREAMEQLSEEHREIISMRHFQDLSYAEIGEVLGVPQGTVMSRLYRARKALAVALRGEEL